MHTGPPLAPSISLDVELLESDNESFFLFTLNWTTPFSWSEFPVTGYKMILSNYSKDEPFNKSYTILAESNNETDSYLMQFNSTGNECYGIDFSVSANNSLGEGESAVIHSGHPIIGNYNTVQKFCHINFVA